MITSRSLSKVETQFSQALRDTDAYRYYRKLADELERDEVSLNLLHDLIRYNQQAPTDKEQVEFDQELQRSKLLLEFLEAERLMIDEYNRLAERFFGETGVGCGSSCSEGCSSSCGGCGSR